MLKKIVHRILRHRHFWREVGFDELSELYISNMFRGLSISLNGLFVPIYMLHLHYSLFAVLSLIALCFTIRSLFTDLLAGHTVAKIGPKHTIFIGYILLISATALFWTLPNYHWPVWLLGLFWGSSGSFFFVPFNVSFSKIKHSKHGGKELGYMSIMEKIGAALGPLVGGVVATVFGAQYIFLISAALLIIGALPLFSSAEPVRLNQRLNFSSLRANGLLRDAISFSALGIENTICMILWPLYLGMFVITGPSVYAKLGFLASVSVLVSIVSAKAIGLRIDQRKGREMLRTSAAINALLNLCRPLITTYLGAFGVNFANEAVTNGYRMPYFKGMYDAADDLPGHRIVYLTSMEMIASNAKAVSWWLLAFLATAVSAKTVTSTGFVIAAIASCVIMSERFRTYRAKGHTIAK